MAGRGSPKGVKQGGRAVGTPNKITTEFKQTVTKLLENNAANVELWLSKVAEGDGDQVKPDPGRALDLLAKLAEYAAPKLSRSEVNADVTVRSLSEELAKLNVK